MLKIRDDVDLKELEKFGFEYFINGCGTYGYSFQIRDGVYANIIEKDMEFPEYSDERIIPLSLPFDVLYDLIQAGLVEKVEDK